MENNIEYLKNSISMIHLKDSSQFVLVDSILKLTNDYSFFQGIDSASLLDEIWDFSFKIEALFFSFYSKNISVEEKNAIRAILLQAKKIDFFDFLYDYFPYSWSKIYLDKEFNVEDQLKIYLNSVNTTFELPNVQIVLSRILQLIILIQKIKEDSQTKIPFDYILGEVYFHSSKYILKSISELEKSLPLILKLAQMASIDFTLSLIIDAMSFKIFAEKNDKFDFQKLQKTNGKNLLVIILNFPLSLDRISVYKKYFSLLSINQKSDFFSSLYFSMLSREFINSNNLNFSTAMFNEKISFIYKELYLPIDVPRTISEKYNNFLYFYTKKIKDIDLEIEDIVNLCKVVDENVERGILDRDFSSSVISFYIEKSSSSDKFLKVIELASLFLKCEKIVLSFIKTFKSIVKNERGNAAKADMNIEEILKKWIALDRGILLNRQFLKIIDEHCLELKNIF